MSIDLLQKRVKVIAYYPHSPYEIGEILVFIDHVENGSAFDLYDSIRQEDACIYAAEIDKATANFQPLPWWSDRDIKDMPEYVVVLPVLDGVEVIVKIDYWAEDFKSAFLVDSPEWVHSDWLHPSIKSEYEAYLKTKW